MTRPRQFDLIVFDWDGTLFDSTALITHCIQAACVDVGAAVPNERDASYVIGMGLVEALQHAAPDLPRERGSCPGAGPRRPRRRERGRRPAPPMRTAAWTCPAARLCPL